MRRPNAAMSLLATAFAAVAAGCTLFTSLDGLSSGAGGTAGPGASVSSNGGGSSASGVGAGAHGAGASVGTGGDASPPADVHVVQRVSLTYASAPTNAEQFPMPVTAGDFLIAVMLTHNPDATVTFGIGDSLDSAWKGTSYRRCDGSAIGTRIWYVESAKAGVEAITVSQSSGTGELGLSIFEYAGVRQLGALDVESGQCAPVATMAMSSPGITTTATDLLVAVFADPCGSATMTAGSGWQLQDLSEPYFYLFEDQEGGGAGMPAGQHQATATDPNDSSCWLGSIAGFKLR